MSKKPDIAHQYTDKLLEDLEKRLYSIYYDAAKEVKEKAEDYFRRFEKKDEKWRLWVANGEKTQEEYIAWRTSQMAVGKRWEDLRDLLAEEFHHANEIAQNVVMGSRAEIYAENHNFATYELEHGLQINTSYTLYSRDAVERILRENPEMLPPPGKSTAKRIKDGLDVRWNRQQVQNAAIQGMLQGESIPKLAKRLAETVGDKNRAAAIRNARTMATGAQNAGRVDAYARAKSKGIHVRQTWVATLDMRTRHEHRILDGQTVDIGEPFTVEGEKIRFPGDPLAAPHLVYNCRCTLIGQIRGFERNVQGFGLRNDPDIEGMSYEEWKEDRREKSQRITHQEEVAESMRRYYTAKYSKK